MSSLLTNTPAMTQQNLNQVENQAPTGLAIANASGNPGDWPVATKMTSDAGALGAVNNAPGDSQAMVSTMSAPRNGTVSVVDAIKNDLVTASNPDAGLSTIQTDIAAQQQLLVSIGGSANCNGQNRLEKATGSITTAASTPGATTAKLTTEQNDVSSLSDSLTTGVGSLVDANMNEAATKLAALQVQQPLGAQALSISNSNTQLILKLFGL